MICQPRPTRVATGTASNGVSVTRARCSTRPGGRAWLCLVGLVGLVGLVATACTSGGGASEASRTITVLTADEAPEIVLPAGAFSEETRDEARIVATTTDTPVVGEPDPDADRPAPTRGTGSGPAATATPDPPPTTRAEEPPKETVPLAEEEPAELFRSTRQAFGDCLEAEGYSFIGPPSDDSEPGDPASRPGYTQAVARCSAESGIAEAVEEFMESRAERTPEQVRQNNEQVLAVVACLRSRGWEVDEPLPDETGALRPGAVFRNPDGEVDRADIRECASAANLGGGAGPAGGRPPGGGGGGFGGAGAGGGGG